jgi:hypothetical protein
MVLIFVPELQSELQHSDACTGLEILTTPVLLRKSALGFEGMAPRAVKTALYKKELGLHQETAVSTCALPDVEALVGKISTAGDRQGGPGSSV